MVYITGDTHGDIDFKRVKAYFKREYVSEKDYLLILGDAGIIWSQKDVYIFDYISLGLTVFFIDGNHENFDLLNKFPIVTKNNAKCHLLSKNIYHVLRGEILLLNDLSFLCLGGATSIDKYLRKEGVSWWPDEHITDNDINNALSNLRLIDNKVDYVLTHCAPSRYVMKMFSFNPDDDTDKLSIIDSAIEYKHWYFGHYHMDKNYGKFRCFYNDILKIESIYTGSKKISYNLLTKEYEDIFLRNYSTGARTNIKEEDLPDWYYINYSYRYWFYNLRGITDIAFVGGSFNNHISKDSRFYLHYHGKLKKDNDEHPLNPDEWDVSTWRCDIVDFIYAVNKYSPHIKTDKIKSQINLVYDQYNGGNFFETNHKVYARPFPEIATPVYKERFTDMIAQYEVVEGDNILSQFISFNRAKEYAKVYVEGNLGIASIRIIYGNEECDFIEAYDTSYTMEKWVYIKKVKL